MADRPRTMRLGSYALITAEGRILLVKVTDGPYAGCWSLPGGGVEFGEDPVAALLREVWEETGLELRDLAIVGIHSSTHEFHNAAGELEDSHRISILFDVALPWLEPLQPEQHGSSSEARWVDPEELKSLRHSPLVETALRLSARHRARQGSRA